MPVPKEKFLNGFKKRCFFYLVLKVFQTGTLAGNVPRCVHVNCHLNAVGKFEFTMTLKLMSSGVFGHFHQLYPWW